MQLEFRALNIQFLVYSHGYFHIIANFLLDGSACGSPDSSRSDLSEVSELDIKMEKEQPCAVDLCRRLKSLKDER